MIQQGISLPTNARLKSLLLAAVCVISMAFSGHVSAQADAIPTDEAVVKAGEKTFTELCTSCHAVHKKMIGPALKNVYERNDLPWIISFIKNSQAVIASGDPYAVKLYEEYNKTQMTSFNYLSDEEITAVVAYIKAETEAGPAVAAASPAADDAVEGAAEAAVGSGISNSTLLSILIVFGVMMIVILIVLALIANVLKKMISTQKGISTEDEELINQGFNIGQFVRSSGFIFLVVVLFTAVTVKTGIDTLYATGIQQGYQPEQPIPYSHELHAGKLAIDCNYCHTGVRKSKNANIPSANICMNCHTEIKTNSPKLQVLYSALDYNVETREYGKNTSPIEWVRIHNLPDHVYFNHQQHVVVGELECQTCHGPIEEMEVVYQYSDLTMGWCINCHRQTEVKAEGNDYYKSVLEAHENRSNEPLKVEDIGGLECSKCHY